jgi:hypothetical protein
VFARNTGQL